MFLLARWKIASSRENGRKNTSWKLLGTNRPSAPVRPSREHRHEICLSFPVWNFAILFVRTPIYHYRQLELGYATLSTRISRLHSLSFGIHDCIRSWSKTFPFGLFFVCQRHVLYPTIARLFSGNPPWSYRWQCANHHKMRGA